jgi:hypothetical protein
MTVCHDVAGKEHNMNAVHRLFVVLLVTLLASWLCAAGAQASSAPPASPTVVGSWLVQKAPQDATPEMKLLAFNADGNMLEASRGHTGSGLWAEAVPKVTVARPSLSDSIRSTAGTTPVPAAAMPQPTADVLRTAQPETGAVPQATTADVLRDYTPGFEMAPYGPHYDAICIGMEVIGGQQYNLTDRMHIELDATGQAFTGEYVTDIYDPTGHLVRTETGTLTGTRIEVEPLS